MAAAVSCSARLHLDREVWAPGETLTGSVLVVLRRTAAAAATPPPFAKHPLSVEDGRRRDGADEEGPKRRGAAEEPFWEGFLSVNPILCLSAYGTEKGIVKESSHATVSRFMTFDTVKHYTQEVRVNLLAAARKAAAAAATTRSAGRAAVAAAHRDTMAKMGDQLQASGNSSNSSHPATSSIDTFAFEAPFAVPLPPNLPPSTCCETPLIACSLRYRAEIHPWLVHAGGSARSGGSNNKAAGALVGPRGGRRKSEEDTHSRVFYVLSAVRRKEWEEALSSSKRLLPSPHPSQYARQTLAVRLMKAFSKTEKAKHLASSGSVTCEVRVLPWVLVMTESLDESLEEKRLPLPKPREQRRLAASTANDSDSGRANAWEEKVGVGRRKVGRRCFTDPASAPAPLTEVHRTLNAALSPPPPPLSPSRSVSVEARVNTSPQVPRRLPPSRRKHEQREKTNGSGGGKREEGPAANGQAALPAAAPPVSLSVNPVVMLDCAEAFAQASIPLPRAHNRSLTVRVYIRNEFHSEPIEAVRVRLLQLRDVRLFETKNHYWSTLAFADYFIAYPPAVMGQLCESCPSSHHHVRGPNSSKMDPSAYPFPLGLAPGQSIVFDVTLTLPKTPLRLSEQFASSLPLPTVRTKLLRSETALDVLLVQRDPRVDRCGEGPSWCVDGDLDHSRIFFSLSPVYLSSVVDARNEVPALPQAFHECTRPRRVEQ